MPNADFEVRQLLKAYRKGVISDALFEEQMEELSGGEAAAYTYNGVSHATEKDMILALLDEFRCGEDFAAEYLNGWIEASDEACVRGGLRTVQQREAFHAQLLEARLRRAGRGPAVHGTGRAAGQGNAFLLVKRERRCGKAPIPCRSAQRPRGHLKAAHRFY